VRIPEVWLDLEILHVIPGRSDALCDHKSFIVNVNPTAYTHLPGGKENVIHNQWL